MAPSASASASAALIGAQSSPVLLQAMHTRTLNLAPSTQGVAPLLAMLTVHVEGAARQLQLTQCQGLCKDAADLLHTYVGQYVDPPVRSHVLPRVHAWLTYLDALGRRMYAPSSQDAAAAALTLAALLPVVAWRMWR